MKYYIRSRSLRSLEIIWVTGLDKIYFLVFGTFIVASEVVTNITCCKIKSMLFWGAERLFSETWKYTLFPGALARFARSLIIMMNVSDTACLKLDVIFLPLSLLYGGNHILVIFAQNICIRNGFFRAQNAKLSLPWEGGHPPPARLLRSLAVLDPRKLLSETWKHLSFPEALAR